MSEKRKLEKLALKLYDCTNYLHMREEQISKLEYQNAQLLKEIENLKKALHEASNLKS